VFSVSSAYIAFTGQNKNKFETKNDEWEAAVFLCRANGTLRLLLCLIYQAVLPDLFKFMVRIKS